MTMDKCGRRTFLAGAVGATLAAAAPAGLEAAVAHAAHPGNTSENASVNNASASDNEQMAFRRAVTTGDTHAIEDLLRPNPSLLYARDAEGQSVYLLAAYAGQRAVMSLLESKGLVLDIYEAMAGLKLDRLNELLRQAPGLLLLPNPAGDTPLHVAALSGQSAAIDNAIAYGPDFSLRNPKRKNETAAHIGLQCPDQAAAEAMAFAMIGNGLDPNLTTTDGDTILHSAARAGYPRVIRLLLQKGADPAAKNAAGQTAVDITRAGGKAGAVELLSNPASMKRDYYAQRYLYGAKFAALQRDDTNGLPRDFINAFVVASHFNPGRVKKWVELCPELLNTRSSWDELPVEAAAHMGRADIGDLLLGRGASYSLCTATVFGSLDDVKRMVTEHPERIQERGAHSFPLLWYSVFGKPRLDVAEYLIKMGADPHDDMRGRTVLHVAAGAGHLELCRYFLELGLDPLQKGATFAGVQDAVESATHGKHPEVAEMINDWIRQKGLQKSSAHPS
jgi:ankyrin repeat protein